MSAVAVAPRALLRRTLERRGMTPEEELELLVAEQQADDTYFVDRPSGMISLDAPSPDGQSTMSDLIGVDEEGEIVLFLPPKHVDSPFDSQKTQHGTIYGYKRLLCRCLPCKAANTKYLSAYRQRRRTES